MSRLHLHWFLPTNGDSRDIVGSGDGSQSTLGAVADGFRRPSIEYLGQIARSAEQLGFEAVLTPTGTWCEDAWLTTAALSQVTTTLKFLVAFRPGLITPTLAAHQAATFQRISGGRLLLNVVTGGDPVEQRRFGDHLDHDQRYSRTDEFLAVLRGVSAATEPFDFTGEHYRIEQARIPFAPFEPPPVFFGGASPAAERVAAKRVDTYLAWGGDAAADRRAAGSDAHARGRGGAGAAVRHPLPRAQPRHGGRGVGRGRPARRPDRRGPGRAGAGAVRGE
ncbi:hypothetical protein GCM10020218_064210 [Dactylosporangium vinaceum]